VCNGVEVNVYVADQRSFAIGQSLVQRDGACTTIAAHLARQKLEEPSNHRVTVNFSRSLDVDAFVMIDRR
jgi:hypothetical protein